MLRPEEVEQLVCGCPTLDLGELRKVTFYDGYKQDDKTIQHFWEVSLSTVKSRALTRVTNWEIIFFLKCHSK